MLLTFRGFATVRVQSSRLRQSSVQIFLWSELNS
jgi:hypothetical protein